MAVRTAMVTAYASVSGTNANLGANIGDHASKGEGIAGTPRLVNTNNYGSLTVYTAEVYYNGSFARGAGRHHLRLHIC